MNVLKVKFLTGGTLKKEESHLEFACGSFPEYIPKTGKVKPHNGLAVDVLNVMSGHPRWAALYNELKWLITDYAHTTRSDITFGFYDHPGKYKSPAVAQSLLNRLAPLFKEWHKSGVCPRKVEFSIEHRSLGPS